MSKTVKMSVKEFSYTIFGMLLGDGCLAKNKQGKRVYLVIEHGPKQEAYARHKAEFLRQHSRYVTVKTSVRQMHGGDYKVTTVRCGLKGNVLRHLNKFERIYTEEGEKIASKYVVNRINARGLMYLFLDDGTASIVKSERGSIIRTYRLGTYGFNDISKRRITEMLLNRFGISSKVIKAGGGNTLHNLGTKGMKNYVDAVRPHLSEIPRSMRYKFDMEYKDDCEYSRWSTAASAA